jgi:hypothetical protein
LSGAEYHELASWVKKRLDEVFPDDPVGSRGQREAREESAGPASGMDGCPGEALPAGAPGASNRRITLIKADDPAGRTRAPSVRTSLDVRPDASAAKTVELAEIRKLFRKTEPPVNFWDDDTPADAPRSRRAGTDDFQEIGIRVKERLDAVFPDDSVPTEVSREERHRLFCGASGTQGPDQDTQGWTKGSSGRRDMPKSLSRLQAIAGEMQLGPLYALDAYAQELERLRAEFEDERHMLVLIELQARLCRYMTARFRSIHQQARTTLLTGFNAMERLTTDIGLSGADRRQLFEQVLQEFKEFNRSLPAGGARPGPGSKSPPTGGRTASAAPPPGRRPEALVSAEHAAALRGFLRDEFRRLEDLLLSRLRRR